MKQFKGIEALDYYLKAKAPEAYRAIPMFQIVSIYDLIILAAQLHIHVQYAMEYVLAVAKGNGYPLTYDQAMETAPYGIGIKVSEDGNSGRVTFQIGSMTKVVTPNILEFTSTDVKYAEIINEVTKEIRPSRLYSNSRKIQGMVEDAFLIWLPLAGEGNQPSFEKFVGRFDKMAIAGYNSLVRRITTKNVEEARTRGQEIYVLENNVREQNKWIVRGTGANGHKFEMVFDSYEPERSSVKIDGKKANIPKQFLYDKTLRAPTFFAELMNRMTEVLD